MLKKEEYIKTVRRPYAPLFFDFIINGGFDYCEFEPFLEEKFAFRNYIVTDGVVCYAKAELDEVTRLTFAAWQNPETLKTAEKELRKREQDLIDSTQKNLSEFGKAYRAYMPAIILVWVSDQPVADKMKKLLSRKLSEEETEELMNQLNIPIEDNFYKKEEYDLVMTDDLAVHVKEYEWLNSRYGEELPYTMEEAQARLSEIDKQEFLQKWKKEKESLKQTIAKAKDLIGSRDAHFVDFMQFIVFYRTQRTDILNKAQYLFIPKLKQLAENNKITYKQLIHATSDEIEKELLDPEVLSQRIADHAIVADETGFHIKIGKECEKIRQFFKDDLGEVNEFKGNIAQKGKVRGKAKIIINRDDYNKISKGDILVTSMTVPNMVPIMKKAAAFVTDEGGITCHAAIISREMKKPCIIGTKIATQVLQDGDEVEVDADNGIVRKLN
jgi:phosphohistidine swiveling domain-containing protein